MKTVQQLVDYIFHSSEEQQDTVLEGLDSAFLSEMDKAEKMPIKKTSLDDAIKKVGIEGCEGKIFTDASGAYASFETAEEYAAVLRQLFDCGKFYDLAELGWVVTYSDDTSSLGNTPKFKVNFISIGETTPGETEGNEDEDADITAIDKIAFKAFKDNGNFTDGKLNPDGHVAESRKLVDSLKLGSTELVNSLLKQKH